jgi:Protein of unknown function (DUF3606)
LADDLKNRGAQDRASLARVNVNEDYEFRGWTQKWGVTPLRDLETSKNA